MSPTAGRFGSKTSENRWLLATPSAWPGVDDDALELTDPQSDDIGDLLSGVLHDWRGEGYLTYHRYRLIAQMHARLVAPLEQSVGDWQDEKIARKAYCDCAAQLAAVLGVGQARAEGLLGRAVDLMTRLPRVAERLRDGIISPDIADKIVERTDLVIDSEDATADPEGGDPVSDPLAEVDAAIAAELDRGAGAWSIHLARDLADRIVFRQQPDAVRARREAAKGDRRTWTSNQGDGMAVVGATMTAERAQLAITTVRDLAATACPNDSRTVPQRNSDAFFALLNRVPFECACGTGEACTATIPSVGELTTGTGLVPVRNKVVMFGVADASTIAGDSNNPGFLEGYGVISGDHVRDLVNEVSTVIRPLVPESMRTLADLLADINEGRSEEIASAGGDDVDAVAESSSEDAPAPEPSVGQGAEHVASLARRDGDPEGPLDAATLDLAVGQGPEHAGSQGRQTGAESPSDATEPDRLSAPASKSDSSADFTYLAPATQPADPYKPSSALDAWVRIRDCYSLFPGNPHSAFRCDLDHWVEYNHDSPSSGGQTEPSNLGAKDRFAHNRKTHGDWVDDLIVTPDGYATPVFITPQGVVIEGRAGPGIDLFPGLRRYRFVPTADAAARRKPRSPRANKSTALRTRTADKHARRQVERERNRRAREVGTAKEPSVVQRIRKARPAAPPIGEPPF
ncbi:hypothetical protein GOEFS_083_00330 [Gordonia effusa NBRC 100432]|uniref:DUF222 domain-containing protein n=1 Tax=Gordonia effusa NBRC 100432 TaxID=1077974 RepID=H0R2V0_9ACTN|nr:DUF222 domain-containing protein [Gordonia effusa]GAB19401.1 hypothetical protein GOEFS_083_00330 [Gordonia effusa NBRC 100432]